MSGNVDFVFVVVIVSVDVVNDAVEAAFVVSSQN